MKIQHEHVVSIPRSKVLEIYTDQEFYVGQLKNGGALTVEIQETGALPGGGVTRKTKVTQPTKVPPMLRTSDTDQYVDNMKVDVAAGKMSYQITPSQFADQFYLAGAIDFVEVGSSTKMVFSTEVEVKIPFIGKKFEKQAIDEAEELVRKQVEFLKNWAAR